MAFLLWFSLLPQPVLIGKTVEIFLMIKNRIKEFRAKYDMKQEELAAKVGVRRETILYSL